jgi:hypothetical protein
LEHGGRADRFLYQEDGPLPVDEAAIRALGVEPVPARMAGADGLVHDPVELARALTALL